MAAMLSHQLPLVFNEIKLDKGLSLLAPKPRIINASYLCNNEAEISLVSHLVKRYRAEYFEGSRFKSKPYAEALSCILANLFYASDYGKQLLYSRSTKGGNKIYIECVNFLASTGLIESTIQPPNDNQRQSWAIATPDLINLLNQHKIRIAYRKDYDYLEVRRKVLIKSGKKKKYKIELVDVPKKAKYKKSVKPIYALNNLWLNNALTLNNKVVIPYVNRVFNNNLGLGGRFFGSFQSIPSRERSKLRFNGKKVVELDYKTLHIRMLYAWEGLPLIGDAYEVEGFSRDTMKAVTFRIINCNTVSGLKSTITLSASPANKQKALDYRVLRSAYEALRKRGLKATPPVKPEWLDSFIDGVPDNTDATALINAFKTRHTAIWHHIGSKDIGLRLQHADSQMMADIINKLTSDDILLLPVHDSIIIEARYKKKARLIMESVFLYHMGQVGIVEAK